MLHLATLIIVSCALSASSEGIAVIGRKSYKPADFCLSDERTPKAREVTSIYNVDDEEFSDCVKQKITHRPSFFYNFFINQYQSKNNNYCSIMDSVLKREEENSGSSEKFAYKKRNLLWTLEGLQSLKTLAPQIPQRATHKPQAKTTTTPKPFLLPCYVLNINEREKFLALKKTKPPKRKRVRRHTRRRHSGGKPSHFRVKISPRETEGELTRVIEKGGFVEKLRYNQAFPRFRNSENFIDSERNKNIGFKNTVQNREEEVRFCDDIPYFRRNSLDYNSKKNTKNVRAVGVKNYIGQSLPNSYVVEINGRRYPHLNHRFIHKRNRKKRRRCKLNVRKTPSKSFPLVKNYRPHLRQTMCDSQIKENDDLNTDNSLNEREDMEEPMGFYSSIEQKITHDFDSKLDMPELYSDIKAVKFDKPTWKRGFNTKQEMEEYLRERNRIIANDYLSHDNQQLRIAMESKDFSTPESTLQKPYLSDTKMKKNIPFLNYDFPDYDEMYAVPPNFPPKHRAPFMQKYKFWRNILPKQSKIRKGLRRHLDHNIPFELKRSPFSKKMDREKKCCCSKSSKCRAPHKSWKSAPLLCVPYIRKGQDELLKNLIALMQKMVGKADSQKFQLFENTKCKPNVKKISNEDIMSGGDSDVDEDKAGGTDFSNNTPSPCDPCQQRLAASQSNRKPEIKTTQKPPTSFSLPNLNQIYTETGANCTAEKCYSTLPPFMMPDASQNATAASLKTTTCLPGATTKPPSNGKPTPEPPTNESNNATGASSQKKSAPDSSKNSKERQSNAVDHSYQCQSDQRSNEKFFPEYMDNQENLDILNHSDSSGESLFSSSSNEPFLLDLPDFDNDEKNSDFSTHNLSDGNYKSYEPFSKKDLDNDFDYNNNLNSLKHLTGASRNKVKGSFNYLNLKDRHRKAKHHFHRPMVRLWSPEEDDIYGLTSTVEPEEEEEDESQIDRQFHWKRRREESARHHKRRSSRRYKREDDYNLDDYVNYDEYLYDSNQNNDDYEKQSPGQIEKNDIDSAEKSLTGDYDWTPLNIEIFTDLATAVTNFQHDSSSTESKVSSSSVVSTGAASSTRSSNLDLVDEINANEVLIASNDPSTLSSTTNDSNSNTFRASSNELTSVEASNATNNTNVEKSLVPSNEQTFTKVTNTTKNAKLDKDLVPSVQQIIVLNSNMSQDPNLITSIASSNLSGLLKILKVTKNPELEKPLAPPAQSDSVQKSNTSKDTNLDKIPASTVQPKQAIQMTSSNSSQELNLVKAVPSSTQSVLAAASNSSQDPNSLKASASVVPTSTKISNSTERGYLDKPLSPPSQSVPLVASNSSQNSNSEKALTASNKSISLEASNMTKSEIPGKALAPPNEPASTKVSNSNKTLSNETNLAILSNATKDSNVVPSLQPVSGVITNSSQDSYLVKAIAPANEPTLVKTSNSSQGSNLPKALLLLLQPSIVKPLNSSQDPNLLKSLSPPIQANLVTVSNTTKDANLDNSVALPIQPPSVTASNFSQDPHLVKPLPPQVLETINTSNSRQDPNLANAIASGNGGTATKVLNSSVEPTSVKVPNPMKILASINGPPVMKGVNFHKDLKSLKAFASMNEPNTKKNLISSEESTSTTVTTASTEATLIKPSPSTILSLSSKNLIAVKASIVDNDKNFEKALRGSSNEGSPEKRSKDSKESTSTKLSSTSTEQMSIETTTSAKEENQESKSTLAKNETQSTTQISTEKSERLTSAKENETVGSTELDEIEDSQTATTVGSAFIVKGPKKQNAKPSPKMFKKVYPDSVLNDNQKYDTTPITVETAATANHNDLQKATSTGSGAPDVRLQLLAVCEGYLEVVKQMKSQNQSLGEDLDSDLTKYCESIISQSFSGKADSAKINKLETISLREGKKEIPNLTKSAGNSFEALKPNNSNFVGSFPKVEKKDKTEGGEAFVISNVERSENNESKQKQNVKEIKKTNKAYNSMKVPEGDDGFMTKGMTQEQLELLRLLKKRKSTLLNWMFNSKEGQSQPEYDETEQFDGDSEEKAEAINFKFGSGTARPRGAILSRKTTKATPELTSYSVYPVYAKHYGYDKGGELRRVELIWHIGNNPTYEKKPFQNHSMMAYLWVNTASPRTKEKRKFVDLSVHSNKIKFEPQINNKNEYGYTTEAATKNSTSSVVVASKNYTSSVVVASKNYTSSVVENTIKTTAAAAATTITATATTITSTATTITSTATTTTRAITTTTTTTTTTTATTTTTTTTNTKATKAGSNIPNIVIYVNETNSSSFTGTVSNSTTKIAGVTKAPKNLKKALNKLGKVNTAKEVVEEYTIEFWNYAVYILPLMFSILFLFCCACCAMSILRKRERKRKTKKKKFSSSEESLSTEDTDSERKNKRREKSKHLKSVWNALKKKNRDKVDSDIVDESNPPEKKKNFLRFLKSAKNDKAEETSSVPYSALPESDEADTHTVVKKTSQSEVHRRIHQNEEQKGNQNGGNKADPNEAAERRELISLLEELKKIEMEQMVEKKEQKSVHVQYMIQDEDDTAFRRLGQTNVFGLPKGYSFCNKSSPFHDPEEYEIYNDPGELDKLLPCECGYYGQKHDYFRHCNFPEEGRCDRFFKIFPNAGMCRHKLPKVKKFSDKDRNCTDKYGSADPQDGRKSRNDANFREKVRDVTAFNLPRRNPNDWVGDMEHFNRLVTKKKPVRLKDDGVLCRL